MSEETFGEGVGGSGGIIRLKGVPVAGGWVPQGGKFLGGILWELQVNSETATFTSMTLLFKKLFLSLSHKTKCPCGWSRVNNNNKQTNKQTTFKKKEQSHPRQQTGHIPPSSPPLPFWGFSHAKEGTRFGGFFKAPSSKGRKRGHKQRIRLRGAVIKAVFFLKIK